MTTTTPVEAEAKAFSDLLARSEQLRQLTMSTRDDLIAAMRSLNTEDGTETAEAREARLIIMNTGTRFLAAMEEALAVGTDVADIWIASYTETDLHMMQFTPRTVTPEDGHSHDDNFPF